MEDSKFPKYALIALIVVAFLAVGFALYPKSKPAPAPVIEVPKVPEQPKVEPKPEKKDEAKNTGVVKPKNRKNKDEDRNDEWKKRVDDKVKEAEDRAKRKER